VSQQQKLLDAFVGCRGPFPFADLVRLLAGLGYEQQSGGITGGSRRTFYNPKLKHVLKFHAPHSKDVKYSTVKALRQQLEDVGAV